MSTTKTDLKSGQWTTNSAHETFNLGEIVGDQLTGGEILLLDGPLGAGKTIFVKGLAAALGIDPEDVTSPSFTLVNPHLGRLPLFHIDLYRLSDGPTAAHAVDLDELVSNESAVIVIEWAERLNNYPLPDTTWQIAINGDGNEARTISLQKTGTENE